MTEGNYSAAAKGKATTAQTNQQQGTGVSTPPATSATRAESRLETFRVQQRAQQEQNLRNRQNELTSSQLASEAGRSVQAIRNVQAQSTRDQYNRYHQRFMQWCDASGYKGDYNATEDKVTRYFACLTCETEDPENGIVRLKPSPTGRDRNAQTKARVASSYASDSIKVDAQGDAEGSIDDSEEENDVDEGESNDREERWYSAATIYIRISAMGDLYRQQCEDEDNRVMSFATVPAPKTYLQPIADAHRKRMDALKRAAATDMSFSSSSFNSTQRPIATVRQLMKQFWLRNSEGATSLRKRRIKGLRDRLDSSLSFFMSCRSEITRHIRLPDLFAHDIEPRRMVHAGEGNNVSDKDEQFVLGVVLVMRQGKTNRDGKIQYGVVVRNKDVEMCPIGALAFYLLELWSPNHKKAPDLDNPRWTDYYLLASNKPMDVPLNHGSQYQAQAEALRECRIQDKGPVGDRGRGKRDVRLAHMCRSTIEPLSTNRHFSSSSSSSASSNDFSTQYYLEGIESSEALRLAGFDRDRQERFCLARNTVIPSLELQRQLFPFIESSFDNRSWERIIENIMLDRDMFFGQHEAGGGEYRGVKEVLTDTTGLHTALSNKDIAMKRHMSLLAHLRKVILQDAAVLLAEGGPTAKHSVFDHPVFSTSEFQRFQQELLRQRQQSLNKAPLSTTTPTSCFSSSSSFSSSSASLPSTSLPPPQQQHSGDSILVSSLAPLMKLELGKIHARLDTQEASIRDLHRKLDAVLMDLRGTTTTTTSSSEWQASKRRRLGDGTSSTSSHGGDGERTFDRRVYHELGALHRVIQTIETRMDSMMATVGADEDDTDGSGGGGGGGSGGGSGRSGSGGGHGAGNGGGNRFHVGGAVHDRGEMVTSVTSTTTRARLEPAERSVQQQQGSTSRNLSAAATTTTITTTMKTSSSSTSPSTQSSEARHRMALSTMGPNDNIDARIREVAAIVAEERRAKGEMEPILPTAPEGRLIPRPNTLEQMWEEWFYGVDGSPSIVALNERFGSAWRASNPQLYKWKKDIVHSVLQSIPAGTRIDRAAVDNALALVRGKIDAARSIAKYYKSLPKGPSKKFSKRGLA